jgi:two-component system cell cycle sensor histidine kinase/response regulator CckA
MDAQAEIRDERTWQPGAVEDGAADTILLVEDEGFVREVTSEVLRSAGYHVLPARNAIEAERAYVQCCGEVDLLLTDVILPGESGSSFAGRLRLANSRLKILLVTGYPEQMGLLEMGREECLAKPFSTRELLERVKQMIAGGELAHEREQLEVRPAFGNPSPA